MHRDTTMKHGGHHLHDSMVNLRHHIDDHLHSRHFWTGVLLALIVVAFATLLFMLAGNTPLNVQGPTYVPYL